MLAALIVGTALTLAPQEDELQVPRPGSLDLRALADAIDPGEVPPLRTLLHAKLRQRLDAYLQTAELPELASSLQAMADNLDERVPLDDRAPVDDVPDETLVLDAALLLYRADRDVPDNFVVPLTTVAFFFAAVPEATAGFTPLTGTLVDATLRRAATRWALKPDLVGWLQRQRQDFDDYADRLHRALAARILRNTDLGEHIPAVLLQLAGRAILLGDHDRALPLFEERIRRLAEDATAYDWLILARQYYLTADPQRGRAAADRARRIGASADTDRVAAFTAIQSRLERIATLLASDDLDDGLAAAELLLTERLMGAAARLFERLATAHPSDARPLVGSARCAAISLDLTAGTRLIEAASTLANKDIHAYEVEAFLTSARNLLEAKRRPPGPQAAARTLFSSVRDGAVRLREIGHEQAECWTEVCDLGLEFAPLIGNDVACGTFLRGLLPRAIELQRRHPGSPAGYELILVAVLFSADTPAALDVLRQAPPPITAVEGLDAQRANTGLVVAVLSGRTDLLDEFEPIVNAVADRCGRAFLSGVRHAILARARAEPSLWQDAAADFAAALTTAPRELRARLHNNLGVALAELGQTEEARRSLELSISADPPTRSFAEYNVALLDLRAGQPASAIAASLTAMPPSADAPWAPARIWAGELLRRDHREADARPLFAEILRIEEVVPGELNANRAGVAFTRKMGFAKNYSGTPPRLWLDLYVRLSAWLIFPPPLTRDQVRELAGR